VGLFHRRLSIIDLSGAGAQPMLDPDTGNRIVFNSEIYNYRALKGHVPEPYILYEGIQALGAGTSFWVDRNGHKESKAFFDLAEELTGTALAVDLCAGEKRPSNFTPRCWIPSVTT
jgi:hypothetical protein